MGRRRQRRLRHRVLEQHAALRQAVQGGGFDIRVAVAAQVVGAERVHGDNHDVERTQSRNFIPGRSERAVCLDRQPASRSMQPRHRIAQTGTRRTHLVLNVSQNENPAAQLVRAADETGQMTTAVRTLRGPPTGSVRPPPRCTRLAEGSRIGDVETKPIAAGSFERIVRRRADAHELFSPM